MIQATTCLLCLQVNAEVETAAVTRRVVGITFTTGVMSSVLPAAPEDQALLPPPYELRVLQQPQKRARRRALNNFKIMTLLTPLAPAQSPKSSTTDGAVPALNLEAAASVATALGSKPNSRPASSRSNPPADPTAAAAAAHATNSGSGSKAVAKTKSSHAAAKTSRSPSVLEEVHSEPEADK